jgi:hypothetical protein
MEMNMFEKCHEGLSVRPKRLSAVLFYNTGPDMLVDPMSLHTGSTHSLYTAHVCVNTKHTKTHIDINSVSYVYTHQVVR